MKYFLALLIANPAFANSFRLTEPGFRFSLQINHTGIRYRSEAIDKTIPMKKCNEDLMKNLNSEILSQLPYQSTKKGLSLSVDSVPLLIEPNSELGKLILSMDARMARLILEETKSCK